MRNLGMAKKATNKKARQTKRAGKSASTKAGDYVREEIDTIRSGEHGAKSAKQAIAIGLSKARRAGVKLPPPKKGKATKKVRDKAKSDLKAGTKKGAAKKVSRKRSKASLDALKKESTSAASKTALSRQAKKAARKRTATDRSAAAKKAARTRKKNNT